MAALTRSLLVGLLWGLTSLHGFAADKEQTLDEVTLSLEESPPASEPFVVTKPAAVSPSTNGHIFNLKHIPLGVPRSDTYLSIGGRFRPRYEHLLQNNWGEDGIRNDGAYYQRLTLNADLHLTKYFRAYGELLSAFAGGVKGGASPIDRDDLDVGQLYAEPSLPFGPNGQNAHLSVRVGRQRLDFASGRLVNSREGPNVYRAFDAIHPELTYKRFRLSGLISRPVENRFYTFDDRPSRKLWLNGASIDYKLTRGLPGVGSLYYLFYQNDQARYVQGTGEEHRHSIGARLAGQRNSWDYDW